jgi:hypothetical protein
MLAKLRSRLRPPTAYEAFAIVLAFLALGSGSYAAITITGKDVKDSSLTGKDVKDRSLTAKDIKKNSLTTTEVKDHSLLARDFQAGQLPAGPRGLKGDKGDAATKLFAAVTKNGVLVYGQGATGATRTSKGDYLVTFRRSLTHCVAEATVGPGDPATPNGLADIINITDNAVADVMGTQVEVLTGYGNGMGSPVSRDDYFQLAVFC